MLSCCRVMIQHPGRLNGVNTWRDNASMPTLRRDFQGAAICRIKAEVDQGPLAKVSVRGGIEIHRVPLWSIPDGFHVGNR